MASEQIPLEALDGALVVGELSLDGNVRHVRGVLPMAATARQQGFRRVFAPQVDAAEAALLPDLEVYAVATLNDLVGICSAANPFSLTHPSIKQSHRFPGPISHSPATISGTKLTAPLERFRPIRANRFNPNNLAFP